MFIKNQNKIFKIKLITRNIKYYRNRGYYGKLFDIIDVHMDDLPKNSSEIVKLYCDYCLERDVKTIIKKRYSYYIDHLQNNLKDCCNKCKYKKIEESNLNKYGVKNISQLDEIKNKKIETCLKNHGVNSGFQLIEKRKRTCLKKYGAEYPTQSKEIQDKIKQTNLEKYGVECYLQTGECKKNLLDKYGVEKNIFQSKEIKDKIKQTNLKKYGVECYLQTEECKEKTKQTCLKKYGVEYSAQSEEIKNKKKQTNLKKLNVEWPSQSKEVQAKIKETNLENWGVENVSQSEEIKNKKIQTCLRNYGVENPMQSETVREKSKKKCLEIYGFDHPWKNPEIRLKCQITSNKVMYKNGTGACSRQQKYLCDLFNVKPNYPVSNYKLDIAFPEEMLYIEYDGSGHDLNVKLGYNRDQFKIDQIKRNYFFQNRGWKLIRIISKKDWLPSDEIIFNLINECKIYLNRGHSWIEIDIDNSKIKCSQYNKKIELGKLRRIKKENANK
jgi:very-short-patch-repair endonuclease